MIAGVGRGSGAENGEDPRTPRSAAVKDRRRQMSGRQDSDPVSTRHPKGDDSC